MNSLDPRAGGRPSGPAASGSRPAAADVIDSVLDLPQPWRLHYGDLLESPRVAYRLAGPPEAPVVAVLGGISAHRVVEGAAGWWPPPWARALAWTAPVTGARDRLPRRAGLELGAGRERDAVSADQFVRSGRGAAARRGASGPAAFARHRGRILRWNGGAVFRATSRQMGAAHRAGQRGRPCAGPFHRLALRAAPDRA